MATQVHCSFCRKSRHQVEKLVAGPRSVYICDRCAILANQIMDSSGRPPRPSPLRRLMRAMRSAIPRRGVERSVLAAQT